MPSIHLDPIFKYLKHFRNDEDGAVTTDFIVLTSSVMLLGLAHLKDIADAANNVGDDIEGCLATDVAAMLDGAPENYVANLQAAGAACSSR